jgi:hypothetical protein
MCDPFTLMALGGSAVSAVGSVTGGIQANNGAGITADFLQHNAAIQSGNADLALGNVDILKKQADVMRESGDVARARARVALAKTQDQGDAVSGAQIAHFASSNLDPTSGSPLLLQLLTASRVKGDHGSDQRRRRSRARQHPHQCGQHRRASRRRSRPRRERLLAGRIDLWQRDRDAPEGFAGADGWYLRRSELAAVGRREAQRRVVRYGGSDRMSDIPIFFQQQPGVGGVSTAVQPQRGIDSAAAPDFSGLGADSKALAGLGTEITNVAVKLAHAQNQTKAAVATTDYLKELDGLEQKYQQDTDFANAPKNFQRDHSELVQRLSANIPDDVIRARTTMEWTRSGISSQKRVRETAWGREVDSNVAATNDLETASVRNAAAAPPASVERLSAADGYLNRSMPRSMPAG